MNCPQCGVHPECAEFRRLFERSGWKKAHAARVLSVAPSSVGRFLTGAVRPKMTLLKLMSWEVREELRRRDTTCGGFRAGADHQAADTPEITALRAALSGVSAAGRRQIVEGVLRIMSGSTGGKIGQRADYHGPATPFGGEHNRFNDGQ